MSENYTYTAADFGRYHSGMMSDTEMHALEKAALRDPFLADALEGYRHTSTPVQDIEALRDKLFSQKKKNVFLLITGNKLARIAAVFVLIAGIGYLTYQLNFDTPSTTLARKEIVDSQKTFDQSLTKDSAPKNTTVEKDIVNNQVIEARTESGKGLKKPDIVNSEDQTTVLRSPEMRSSESQPLSKGTRDVDTRSPKNIVTGRVVDTRGNPISRATIKDKDERTVATSDSSGRFKMASNDSMVTATIAVPGYATKQKTLSDKNEQVIVMQEGSDSPKELAVNTAPPGQTRMMKAENKKVPGATTAGNNAEPVEGWNKFNEYIRRDITIPVDPTGKNYKGKVLLSFEITKRGNVTNIKVEQSLCSSCDEEAKRLLRQGPKWKYLNDKRQLVTIEF